MVDPIEWNLSGMSDRDRTARLLNPATGEDLIIAVAAEAFEAAIQGRSSWSWQDGEHLAGCGRAIASFPLKADTFDALFNGRSGYRAQYYLSCQEGSNFNAMLIGALLKPLRAACDRAPASHATLLQHSFGGPFSKVWVLGDGGPFCAAPTDEFKPRRWFEKIRFQRECGRHSLVFRESKSRAAGSTRRVCNTGKTLFGKAIVTAIYLKPVSCKTCYAPHDSQKPAGASLPGRSSDTSQRRKRILVDGRRQGLPVHRVLFLALVASLRLDGRRRRGK